MLDTAFLIFIVLAPGIVALSGLVHKITGDRFVMVLTTGTVLTCGVLSLYNLFALAFHWGAVGGAEESHTAMAFKDIHLTTWMDVGGLKADWAIRVDALSITMMAVITSVAGLVHLYSWGYMDEDPHKARFFAYLSLFTFAMLMLVVADNFIQLFFGWEGVGLASYLLIGFWYQKKAPNDAAIKAFVTNRVGDFGLALGIMVIFFTFGTVEFDPIFEAIRANSFDALNAAGDRLVQPIATFAEGAVPTTAAFNFLGYEVNAFEAAGVLLFIGAMGKSAQFFLHVWLPDAMEGPTPVSALIHAATMVTAGVYLVCLLSPIYEHTVFAAGMITLIGAITALYAATVGLAQNDIKRVIAYSTCSQLGYMFFAAGVGAYEGAMFHLFTHAFFKALLFLGAGSVIHGMHHEQDMRRMGGVRRFMPITYAAMMIGTIAIIGIGIPLVDLPFAGLSGFYSKDGIIESAFVAGQQGVPYGMLAFWFGIVAALLTSFYSWRLIYMTFHGPYTGAHHLHAEESHGTGGDHGHHDHHAHDPHESPWVMLLPLIILSVGAVAAGVTFYDPMFHHGEAFWGDAIYRAEGNHIIHDIDDLKKDGGYTWVFLAPVVVTIAGFLIATFTYFFNRGIGKRMADSGGPLHAVLANKWYFDEIYQFLIVRPLAWLGDLFWKGGDGRIIDGLGPDGVTAASRWGARRLSALHTGYLYHYAFVVIGAALVFGGLMYWRSGGAG
ncbi:MAG: NADH-quinone oxidoreductase subunit L [Pseudomonadota bacterium]